MLIFKKIHPHTVMKEIPYIEGPVVAKCPLHEKAKASRCNKNKTPTSITIALHHHDESSPPSPLKTKSFKVCLEGGRAAMCRNWGWVFVLALRVTMVHSRHSILESRSLSGRGDSCNISPQEFIEKSRQGQGMGIGFQPLLPGPKGQKHPI